MSKIDILELLLCSSKLSLTNLNNIYYKKINIKQSVSNHHLQSYIKKNNLANITAKLFFYDDIILDNNYDYKIILIIGSIYFNNNIYYYTTTILEDSSNILKKINLSIALSFNELLLKCLSHKDFIMMEAWFISRIIGYFLDKYTFIRIFDDKLDNYSIYYEVLQLYFNEYKNYCNYICYDDYSSIEDFIESNNIIFNNNYIYSKNLNKYLI